MSDQYFDPISLACADISDKKKKKDTFYRGLFYPEVKEQISIF